MVLVESLLVDSLFRVVLGEIVCMFGGGSCVFVCFVVL